jgi:integrase
MPRKSKQRKHKGVFERDKGSDIWWVRFTNHDGKRVSRCIGTFSDACNFVDEQKVRVRRQIIAPVPSHRGVRYSQLVEEAIKRSDKDRSDHRNFEQRLKVSVEQFGHRMADTIQPSEIAEWFDEMEDDREWSNATINRYRAAMSKVYKLALADEKVTRNPVRLVPMKPENNGRLRFLSGEEEQHLRAAIKRDGYMRHFDIALNTGMRKGEQFSITPDQIDFDQKYVYLSKTKNGSDRYVSLNSTALSTFRDLKAEHARRGFDHGATLFLSWQHKPMADPRVWFSEACEEAKIVGVTWHTIRHTFASRLVMAGVGLKTLQELMGHKTIAMSARYAHLAPAHKLNALELLVPSGEQAA